MVKRISKILLSSLSFSLYYSEGWMEQGFEELNSEVDIKQDPGMEKIL